MAAKLIEPGTDGNRTREIAIQGEEFLIGRGADCNLRLRLSAVSRHHCLLRIRAHEASVTDLGSANGTFVNGKRVRTQVPLMSGDELRVGSIRFVVDLGDGIDLDATSQADSTAATCKLSDLEKKKKEA